MYVNGLLEKLKKNRWTLILSSFVGAVFLLLLGMYLAVPSYMFEPQPFTGSFIYNPYEGVGEDAFSNPHYYDFRNEDSDNDGINSYEYGFSLSGTRYLCINYPEKRKMDFPFMQSVHCKQFNIDRLRRENGVVALAHPSHGFKKGELKNLDHYRCIEALSHGDNSLEYWDIALSNGHRVNVVANGCPNGYSDDVNGYSYHTAVLSASVDAASVCKSLETGSAYGVASKGRLSDVLPLKSVDLQGDTLSISMPSVVKEMRFIGQEGKIKFKVNDVDECSYFFSDDDTYIRVEVEQNDGSILYLNPLVRHEFAYFFDWDHCKLMKGRTYFMWAVYIVVVFAFLKNVLVKIIKKNED